MVRLPPLKPLPPFLHSLYYTDANTVEGRHFKSLIRTYNSAIAFTSVNYRQNDRIDLRGIGIHSFHIHGELYHLQGPLQPSIGRKPCFAQLYFVHASYAAQVYTTIDTNLHEGLLKSLMQELRMENPWYLLYKTAYKRMKEQQASQLERRIQAIINPQLRLIMEYGADRRRENLPTALEVAAIIPEEDEEISYRDIIVTYREMEGQHKYHRIDPESGMILTNIYFFLLLTYY